MNIDNKNDTNYLKSLKILDELSKNSHVTQRDLSSKLGIALGLVNSYIKNLAKKGYITVQAIPPKRYVYYLTPTGLSEKTRLTYNLLKDYNRIFRDARMNIKSLFVELETEGVRNVVFAGVDEVTEIAYLILKETDMRLVGVVDSPVSPGMRFLEIEVFPYEKLSDLNYDCIVVTSFVKRKSIEEALKKMHVPENQVKVIFS